MWPIIIFLLMLVAGIGLWIFGHPALAAASFFLAMLYGLTQYNKHGDRQ